MMFIQSIAIWYHSDYRPDKAQMAMLYPARDFKNEQSVIEWALNQRINVTMLIAYNSKAEPVVTWSK